MFALVLYSVLWGFYVLQVLATTRNVCNTPSCIRTAESVLNNMDSTMKPCDDFYHFACGNYLKREKIKEGKTQVSSFVTVDNLIQKQIRQMLETPPNKPEPRPFKMARDLYKICLRQDLMDKRGVSFVLDTIKDVGGWPVLEGDKWNATIYSWVRTVYKLHELGLGGELFDFSVSVDLANSFRRVIEIDQVSFIVNRDYMILGRDNKLVQAYGSYMIDIVKLFGANHDVAVRDVSEALDFEIELAKITMSQEERSNLTKLYNPMELPVLQARYPVVLWDLYLNRMMNHIHRLRTNETIVVKTPKYLTKLQALLWRTERRTLANYLVWRGISGTVRLLTTAMRDRHLLFHQILTGRKVNLPRWKECLGITTGSFSLAIGAMYVRNYFQQEAKENAVDMVERIRKEMVKVLETVDWMDEETRAKAIEKAHAMQKHIAYPSELLEDRKIEEFYSKLEITGEKYFESILNLTRFGWDYSVTKLRETINKTDWRYHGCVATIKAFYNPLENSVQFPAGILQDVFFSQDRPRYMNYGGIGFIVGHEITHGFDDIGRRFDKLGNMVGWWTPKTGEEFKNHVQCVIDQADNYTVVSVKMSLNGTNTQCDNVADIAGSKLSRLAYRAWVAEHHEEPRLPRLEQYSPQQMFWLSAANVWCTVYREPALKMQITTGYHSPAEYRINGAFRNQVAFAKDYNCPVGSKMNPTNKCNVW